MSGKPPGPPPVNYTAGCCVCGTYLNGSWLEEDAPFLNDEEWIRNEQGKILFLNAQELESKYIDTDEPGIWTSFFRLCRCAPPLSTESIRYMYKNDQKGELTIYRFV